MIPGAGNDCTVYDGILLPPCGHQHTYCNRNKTAVVQCTVAYACYIHTSNEFQLVARSISVPLHPHFST